MKTKTLFALLLLMLSTRGFSQIALPKQFNCVLSPDTFRENYFTDGTYQFKTDSWGNSDIENGEQLVKELTNIYERKLTFKKTKDNLYWGTGVYGGRYYYIMVVPESLATITLSASKNGTQFSNYSTWLLQQVRNNHNSGLDYYLTNYKGKTCSQNLND